MPVRAARLPLLVQNDPILAADRFRRARELYQRARRDLIDSVIANRKAIHIEAVSARSGMHSSSLRKMIEREESHGGE